VAIVLPKFSRNNLSSRSRNSRSLEPSLSIRLLSLQPCFEPGDVLEGEYTIAPALLTDRINRAGNLLAYVPRKAATKSQAAKPQSDSVQGLELSVVWYTEGKGGEDLGVHYFERFTANDIYHNVANRTCNFTTKLPFSPLSYEGHLMKLRWCVRARLFTTKGNDICTQLPFYLGQVTREV
jgi:hypothetical protein